MAERTPIPAGAYERLARQLRADMLRKQFLEQMQAARQAEDMKGRHSVGPDERRPTNPNLISNALLAGTLGGAMSAAGLPAVGLRAGLIGGGLTDATLNAGNPEGGAEISGALAAAGALGRHSIPAAIAALGASSSEAAGMPFHSWMKRLNSLNKVEPTAMYVNPTNAELLSMMRDARETYPTSPTVRLLRDQRSNDVYGVEGSSILHDDMRKHLKLKYEFSPGSQGSTLPELDTELHFLKSLPRLAGGGAIKRLGKRAMSQFDELRPSSVAPQGALSVVKPKGGNWLAGSVEDALINLRRGPALATEQAVRKIMEARPDLTREQALDFVQPIEASPVEAAIDNWVTGPLTKYVKTRMASPDDEVRRLAEQGVLHFEPQNLNAAAAWHRMQSPIGKQMGQTQLAKNWESVSDASVNMSPASTYQNFGSSNLGEEWINKLDPETPFYRATQQLPRELGFNHLIDEVSNALDPNSGLPPHLQLSPEAVKNLSMEKAVRRVADINAFRAAQQVEANRKLAEQASLVREYAENNPKGLRWVELKAPETSWKEGEPIPEGFSLSSGRKPGTFIAQHSGALESSGTHPSAEAAVNTVLRKRALQDQLKYEGDTMGHCVGGYCPDVLEGRSRIFSLRDAKGEPHVTVEVRSKPNDPRFEAPQELQDAWARQAHADAKRAGFKDETDDYMEAVIEREQELAEAWAESLPKNQQRIIQIKGKQNRAPNPEYLPFVQDFVRNSPLGSPWSDVGDLGNTGLLTVEKKLHPSGFINRAELEAAAKSPPEGYVAEDFIWPDRYAHGGAVTKQPNPADNFQGIIAAIEEALA